MEEKGYYGGPWTFELNRFFLGRWGVSKKARRRVRLFGKMTKKKGEYSSKQGKYKKKEDQEEILGGISGIKKTVGRCRRRVEYQNVDRCEDIREKSLEIEDTGEAEKTYGDREYRNWSK